MKKRVTNLEKQVAERLPDAKQGVLILAETDTPGVYSFRGKVVTEGEIAELQQGYRKTIRMRHRKN
jgi:hypothetical protein